jgi:S-adenosylmethionine decarboxylase
MSNYNPGLHILASFSAPIAALTAMDSCRTFFDGTVTQLGLTKVGDVYHDFPNGGFTAVVCLTESHVSIHTWPEHGLATFDVFLSNFHNDNSEKVRQFYAATLRHFDATEISKQEVKR